MPIYNYLPLYLHLQHIESVVFSSNTLVSDMLEEPMDHYPDHGAGFGCIVHLFLMAGLWLI